MAEARNLHSRVDKLTPIRSLGRRLHARLENPQVQKILNDNVGMLSTVIAWNALTSLVPVVIGLLSITGIILQGQPSMQRSMVTALHNALRGVLSTQDLEQMVATMTSHSGLFAVIGVLGVVWGGSNVGGAISTAFRPIFDTRGRAFVKEKLIDIGMLLVMAILMIVIVLASTYSTVAKRLVSDFPLSGAISVFIGIAVGLMAGFALFFAIYTAFPNTTLRMKFRHVWQGAAVASILFEILSLIWPIYAHFAHFSRYGAILLPILLLTAWLYLFAVITVIGAEVTALAMRRDAEPGR